MDVLWLTVLGLLFAGWVALDGFTVGAGMLLPFLGRGEDERRLLLTTMGRFLLPNEVWLIGTAGVLAGAFPTLEGELFTGARPVVIALLLSWVWRDAAIWFRSRRPGAGWRRGWEGVLVLASGCLAAAVGVLLAELGRGLARGDFDSTPAERFGPYAWLAAGTAVLAFAAHGAVFLALRATGPAAERARRTATRLVPAALGAVLALIAAVTPQLPVRAGTMPAVGLTFGALGALAWVAAAVLTRRGRLALAFGATACGAALPVLGLAAALGAAMLDRAADTAALTWLTAFVLPVLAPVLAAQAWLWWLFRGRVDARTVGFF